MAGRPTERSFSGKAYPSKSPDGAGPAAHAPCVAGRPVQATQQRQLPRQQQQVQLYEASISLLQSWRLHGTQGFSV
jgi:hypothetical protein